MSTVLVTKVLQQSSDGIVNVGTYAFDGSAAAILSGNMYSLPVRVERDDTAGLHVTCTGGSSPNGTVTIQGSNDLSKFEGNAQTSNEQVNWATIAFWDEASGTWATSKAIASTVSYLLTIPVCSFRWLRMLWTNTSGTCQLKAALQLKGDGGR